MIQNTLMIFGPGGIGKSPLDHIVRPDALRIDPYRLRKSGPRDKADSFYAHPKLKAELEGAFRRCSASCERLSSDPVVEWWPQTMTTFFDVRGEWQCLLLDGLDAAYAKGEVYAPAVPSLFARSDVRRLFGELSIVVLDPGPPLRTLTDFASLRQQTEANCLARGDTSESASKRARSVDSEAVAWRAMLDLGGREFATWPFAEHRYRGRFRDTLIEARRALVAGDARLGAFFVDEAHIMKHFTNERDA